MLPESQTLFSLTLFLALSSLLAWSNRRNRSLIPCRRSVVASVLRDEGSVDEA